MYTVFLYEQQAIPSFLCLCGRVFNTEKSLILCLYGNVPWKGWIFIYPHNYSRYDNYQRKVIDHNLRLHVYVVPSTHFCVQCMWLSTWLSQLKQIMLTFPKYHSYTSIFMSVCVLHAFPIAPTQLLPYRDRMSTSQLYFRNRCISMSHLIID